MTTVCVTVSALWCQIPDVWVLTKREVRKPWKGMTRWKWRSEVTGVDLKKNLCVPVSSDYDGLTKILPPPIALAEEDWIKYVETVLKDRLNIKRKKQGEGRGKSTTPFLQMKWRAFHYDTWLCLTDFIIEIISKLVHIQSAKNKSSWRKRRQPD